MLLVTPALWPPAAAPFVGDMSVFVCAHVYAWVWAEIDDTTSSQDPANIRVEVVTGTAEVFELSAGVLGK